MYPYNKKLVKNAQTLRKNMTPEEKNLWYKFLKKLPITVKRQHNIENYILDFYIADKKLAIEIDGMQHGEEKNAFLDQIRDTELAKWGIKVVRYSNIDVNNNFEGVVFDLLGKLGLSELDVKW